MTVPTPFPNFRFLNGELYSVKSLMLPLIELRILCSTCLCLLVTFFVDCLVDWKHCILRRYLLQLPDKRLRLHQPHAWGKNSVLIDF